MMYVTARGLHDLHRVFEPEHVKFVGEPISQERQNQVHQAAAEVRDVRKTVVEVIGDVKDELSKSPIAPMIALINCPH